MNRQQQLERLIKQYYDFYNTNSFYLTHTRTKGVAIQ